MKAKFLALAALVLGLASCQTDMVDGVKVDANGEAPVTLQVGLPQDAATRANSAVGAVDNEVDMDLYDIRFILAVYDKEGVLAKGPMVKHGDATEASFSFRLVPGRKYHFVAWADFVDNNSDADLHYDTTEFPVVSLKDGEPQNLNDESRDAYTQVVTVDEFTGASSIPTMVLKRPFAKLRVVTTDMDQLYTNLKQSTVTYTSKVYTSFNALDSKVYGDADYISEKTVKYTANKDDYYTNYVYGAPANGEMTLFADYLFGGEDDRVMFTMYVEDYTTNVIPTIEFNTNIPVQRNYLTTVQGPILTDPNNITVTIDSRFEGNHNVDAIEVFDAADLQNAIKNASSENETHIILYEDIDLNELTRAAADPSLTIAAGKNLSIDLNGKTLSATSTETGKNYNMFDVRGTLTIQNGTIKYEHKGDNMGWNSSTNLFNITAGGVLNLEYVTAKNLGGSDMAFVAHLNNWGEATLNVKNSTLESTYIAVRAFNSGNDMNNITIYNSTLKGKYCFWVHNYKGAGDSAGTDDTLNLDICNGTNEFVYTGKAPILYGFNEPLYFNENGVQLYYDAAALASVLTSDNENIVVALGADIDLPISSLGQQTGGSGEYKLGGENTENITIDLNGKKLNITTTYWSVLGAKNADALFTIKNGTMTSSQTSGTWNSYDLCFANCNYDFENVVFAKAIALESANKTYNLKSVSITETHDYYAMWISAKGQTVNVDGLTIESAGRGIKIDEQYVNAPAKVTLNIKNATFKTAKKAAIVVKSVVGAEINASNLDIREVAADNKCAVWVDEDSAQNANRVIVNGADVKVEGYDFVANGLLKQGNSYVVMNANGLVALSENGLKSGETVKLGANIDLAGVEFNGLDTFHPENGTTFDGQGYTVSNWTNNSKVSDMGFIRNWVGTIKNVKFENCHLKTAGRSAIAAAKVYGDIEDVTINNCSIEDSYWACGLVAGLYNAGNISNCTVTNSSVKSNGGTGGIVGVINETGGVRELTKCMVSNSTINNTGVYGEVYSGGGLVGMFNADNATYKFGECAVSNNTLEGKHVFEMYPADDSIVNE